MAITGIFLSAVLAQAYYSPAEAQGLFTLGNDAYDRADYAKAREDYEKLLAHGHGGPDVLYNLGTNALASGDLGGAVLYLERAKRLGGHAEDVDANLAVARSKQLDQVIGAGADEPFIERVVDATSDAWASWGFLGFWAVAFALLIVRGLWRGPGRGWLLALSLLFLLMSVPTGALVAAHAYARDSLVDAVVMAHTLPARELPKDSAKVSFEIHAGLKVRLMEQVNNYVKIRLPNGLEGWSPKDGLAEI